MNFRKHLFACCAITCLLMAANLPEGYAQTIRYVSTSGNDNNAGNSWGAAFRTVRKALQVATAGQQVWVAKGTYYPDEGPGAVNNDRYSSFEMASEVAIYGGFDGTEIASFQRNISLNPTLLSGEIQQDNDASNNSYNVIYLSNRYLVIIDGFIIEGGNANDTSSQPNRFSYSGGGVSISANSVVVINNCEIKNNRTSGEGGGIFAVQSQVRLNQCSIHDCIAANGGGVNGIGVGYYLRFNNCILYRNSGTIRAGGIESNNIVTFTHSILVNNISPVGGAVVGSVGLEFIAKNAIIQNNGNSPISFEDGASFNFSHCLLSFIGFTQNNCYYVEPGFADTANGNFRLTDCAFAINRGTNTEVPAIDFEGNPRIVFGQADIGAYEYQGPVNPAVIYVKAGGAGTMDGSSWGNAFATLRDGLNKANTCFPVKEIWVVGGIYYPDEGAGATNNSRENAFSSNRNHLSVYGGFAGNETELSQRNLNGQHTSVLSGEIQQDNIPGNNSYNVIRQGSVDSTFILDGFTIQDGYAGNNIPNATGSGGGIYLSGTNSIYRNCIIKNNTATYGGGVAMDNATSNFINCLFINNTTLVSNGVVLNSNASPRFINCTIANNTLQGADKTPMVNTGVSSPVILNTIITGSSPAISGGTPIVSYSLIQNTTPFAGTGNLIGSPLFLDGALGDYRLNDCSPAFNTATATGAPNTDILGQPRPALGGIDMGAYELQAIVSGQGRLFVSGNALAGGDGGSWATAIHKLQDALAIATACNSIIEIWVAAGTYFPDEGAGIANNNREAFFTLRNGLAIYGGFAGTETQLSQRNLAGAPTILSGEIQADGDPLNNTNNLFRNTGVNATAILDGFTLRGGAATVAGGAMLNTNASPTIRHCIFEANTAVFNGGAVRNNSSSNPAFVNCVFRANTGSGNGGVIFNTESSPSFTNCTFANNTASGGSVFFSQTNSALTLTNCIVWGNTGTSQISNTSTSTNAIIYSIVQGGFSGTGNLNANPLFMDAAAGNFRLLSCSPAINTGTATLAPLTDITGTPRPLLGLHDMGAYEYAGKLVLPNNGVLYVNATAAGNNTGNSWTNALTNLQDAFNNNCTTVTQIWVAAGTYKPTTGTDRNISFALKNGMAIYGGFAGTETQLSQRNWFVNPTILSGDIGSPGSAQDNSFTIVEASNTNATAIIDGFTISNANAFESGVINTTSRGMNGGGMYAQNGSPTISNCHFKDNNARHNGGGFYNISGSPEITNCIFSGNRAEWGGGLYNYVNASPVLRNCLFYRNRSFSNGGALLNNSSSNPVGIHCTFAGNIGVNGVAIANYNSAELALISSIVWEEANTLLQVNAPTPAILYSILKGGFAGEGNLDADPLFINAATDNYQLQACSPAINAGLAWIGSITYDILGNNRPAFGGFDMGAYERQAAQPQILYVDSTATGIGDGSSWANAFTKLEAALSAIKNCGAANTIHIAKGTYKPPPPAIAFIMDKQNAIVLGGYPSGGNGARNAAVNPVIIKGNVQVLKSLQFDGVKVEKSDMADPL